MIVVQQYDGHRLTVKGKVKTNMKNTLLVKIYDETDDKIFVVSISLIKITN
jgi:hypothetical protein